MAVYLRSYTIVCNSIQLSTNVIINSIQLMLGTFEFPAGNSKLYSLDSWPKTQNLWIPGREFKTIYKELYKVVMYTIVYNRMQSYTNVYNPIQPYTIVCNCIRLYTTVVIVHNWLFRMLLKIMLFWIPGRECKTIDKQLYTVVYLQSYTIV